MERAIQREQPVSKPSSKRPDLRSNSQRPEGTPKSTTQEAESNGWVVVGTDRRLF